MRSLVFAPAIRVALLTALAVAPAESLQAQTASPAETIEIDAEAGADLFLRTFGKRWSAPSGPSGGLGHS